jgi:mannose-1-phosphate guanylyltransferase
MSRGIRPVVLAGGGGTRLWPLSTPERPKHLLPLDGDRSLLESTLARVADPERFLPAFLVCSGGHADEIARLAPATRLLVEPVGRNSAPAIAAAAIAADGEELLLVLPSDHHIGDAQPLLDAVARGAALAAGGWIVTFGIQPSRIETGYGYVVPEADLGDGAFRAARFVEKPSAQAARALVDQGSYWNAGIFLLSAQTALDCLRSLAPQVLGAVESAMPQDAQGGTIFLEEGAFREAPSISFDHAVMEHAPKVAVVPVTLDWSDLGTWESVYERAAKDSCGNAASGGAALLDSRNCLARSDGPAIIAVGVEDLVIVATPTHVLVVPRDQAQRVREAAELAARADEKP